MLDGYMEDAAGNMVPLAKVKPEHLEEDALVRRLVERAGALHEALAGFKAFALGEVGALKDLLAEKHDVTLGGRKGNMTLTSYDGRLRVQVAVGEALAFGPELSAAKALIDACVQKWSEGASENLTALVDHAFQVNKQGRIDTHRVLGLRRLKIDDPQWLRAMDAIADAVRVTGTTTYIRFYQRREGSDVMDAITLDLAKL